ncbi:MAG: hypothetical protein DME06_06140 [Candidatus Rokuibacteriota bacterium]|nr:MAG: hypothetical protein DME06_06140 [Candidatus Rokubacteria bacterium]
MTARAPCCLVLLVATLAAGGCGDEPTEAQRHRDNVRCAEFASGLTAERTEAAYQRCMDGGRGRFKAPEDSPPSN